MTSHRLLPRPVQPGPAVAKPTRFAADRTRNREVIPVRWRLRARYRPPYPSARHPGILHHAAGLWVNQKYSTALSPILKSVKLNWLMISPVFCRAALPATRGDAGTLNVNSFNISLELTVVYRWTGSTSTVKLPTATSISSLT